MNNITNKARIEKICWSARQLFHPKMPQSLTNMNCSTCRALLATAIKHLYVTNKALINISIYKQLQINFDVMALRDELWSSVHYELKSRCAVCTVNVF